jgi:hypothetical protein
MLRRQLLASTAIALMLTSRSEAREISGQMPCSAGAAGLRHDSAAVIRASPSAAPRVARRGSPASMRSRSGSSMPC